MGFNSPIPVKLQDETKKAAKILRSFTSGKDVDVGKVIPKSILQRAAGFAIFTVVKAGFVISARAGSGVVIARTSDGGWSPPSAIGLGGFGFGGQLGAEVTDFLIVLNSRAAVTSFMSAGSLTLGGNLSVAVGPLGRNAEGGGAVNAKGNMAAIYSYSKTKGLFGGVSVEGSVIVERQDANRLAYGANIGVTQILSGQFDPPPWANVLTAELDRVSGGGGMARDREAANKEYDVYDDLRQESRDRESNRQPQPWEEEPEDVWQSPSSKKKNRDRSSSNASGSSYAFGGGIGGHGNTSTTPPRSRASSILRKNPESSPNGLVGAYDANARGSSPRPSLAKRASGLNPFGSGSNTPKKQLPPSSESYNAGLTWDSSGPVTHGGRSRSGSNAVPPGDEDLLGDWGEGTLKGNANGNAARRNSDLLGTWSNDERGLSASFANLNTGGGSGSGSRSGSTSGNRSRSNSKAPAPTFDDIAEDEYVPHETESRFAKMAPSPPNGFNGTRTTISAGTKARPMSSFVPSGSTSSPFGSDTVERRPFDDYFNPGSKIVPEPYSKPPLPARRLASPSTPPSLALKSGLGPTNDGYARAVALYEFKAVQGGDLGLVRGDVVVVKDRVGNGEWWSGSRAGGGGEGIFPKSYVEVLGVPKELKGGLTKSELKARMASPFE